MQAQRISYFELAHAHDMLHACWHRKASFAEEASSITVEKMIQMKVTMLSHGWKRDMLKGPGVKFCANKMRITIGMQSAGSIENVSHTISNFGIILNIIAKTHRLTPKMKGNMAWQPCATAERSRELNK